jgi:hypothetical protein
MQLFISFSIIQYKRISRNVQNWTHSFTSHPYPNNELVPLLSTVCSHKWVDTNINILLSKSQKLLYFGSVHHPKQVTNFMEMNFSFSKRYPFIQIFATVAFTDSTESKSQTATNILLTTSWKYKYNEGLNCLL